MKTDKNYYEILGVSKDASQDDIKAAFRKLTLKYHPDNKKSDEANEEKFKEIAEAYEILGDQERRSAYDSRGEGIGDMAAFFERLRRDFGINVGNMRVCPFRTNGHDSRVNGGDIETAVPLSYEEISAKENTVKNIEIERIERCRSCEDHMGLKDGKAKNPCKICNGRGSVTTHTSNGRGVSFHIVECKACNGKGFTIADEDKCDGCKGEGVIKVKENIDITIPRGIHQGQKLRIKGKGNCGFNGGENGNLWVYIFEQAHSIFKRNGNDLILELPITVSQSVLGDKISVPALKDRIVEIEIPEGVSTGDYIRKPGYGFPQIGSDVIGSLIVVFRIVPMKISTDEEKELFNRVRELEQKNPIKDDQIEKIKQYSEGIQNVQKENSVG